VRVDESPARVRSAGSSLRRDDLCGLGARGLRRDQRRGSINGSFYLWLADSSDRDYKGYATLADVLVVYRVPAGSGAAERKLFRQIVMHELAIAAGATLVASGLAPSRTRATNDLKNNAVAVNRVRMKDNLVLPAGVHVVRSGRNDFSRVTIT
jgi:hypothetical protein